MIALGGTDLAVRIRCAGLYLRDSFAIFLPGPKLESAFLFRKPGELVELEGLTARGMLNIDACRTPGLAKVPWGKIRAYRVFHNQSWDGPATTDAPPANPLGRWPTNVAFVHGPDCFNQDKEWTCSGGCPVLRLPVKDDDIAELYPQFAGGWELFAWLGNLITPPGHECTFRPRGVCAPT